MNGGGDGGRHLCGWCVQHAPGSAWQERQSYGAGAAIASPYLEGFFDLKVEVQFPFVL